MNWLVLLDPLYRWLTRYMSATGLILYGGKGSPPPPPDYRAAAQEQAGASKEITTAQTYANRPTQNTPWGSTTWSTDKQIDPATGQEVTAWTQNQSLDPRLQSALDDQLAIQSGRSDLAQGFMGRVADAYSQPFDWQNLPEMAGRPDTQWSGVTGGPTTQTTNEAAFGGERRRIEDQLFQRMRPEQEIAQNQLQTQLANQGLTPGSQAYNQEMKRLGDQQSRERFNALEMGGQEQARLQQMLLGQQQQAFGQQRQLDTQQMAANAQNYSQEMQGSQYQNQLRQQAIAEQEKRRSMSLNELNAMLYGQQVNSPTMPSFSSAARSETPNYMQAAQLGYQGGLDAYNAGQQQDQSMMSGLFGLGKTAASIYFSDARLKSAITLVGMLGLIGLYEYVIGGRRERGVLAQEVARFYPRVVGFDKDGWLWVDYAALQRELNHG